MKLSGTEEGGDKLPGKDREEIKRAGRQITSLSLTLKELNLILSRLDGQRKKNSNKCKLTPKGPINETRQTYKPNSHQTTSFSQTEHNHPLPHQNLSTHHKPIRRPLKR